MKNFLLLSLSLLLAAASCKKRNGDIKQTPEEIRAPLEILKAHNWKMKEAYRVHYHAGATDTSRNPHDSCLVYTVGEEGQPGGFDQYYTWLADNICSTPSAPSVYNVFYIIEEQNKIAWGYYTLYFDLVRLDDEFFIKKYNFGSNIPGDSSVDYQVYISVD